MRPSPSTVSESWRVERILFKEYILTFFTDFSLSLLSFKYSFLNSSIFLYIPLYYRFFFTDLKYGLTPSPGRISRSAGATSSSWLRWRCEQLLLSSIWDYSSLIFCYIIFYSILYSSTLYSLLLFILYSLLLYTLLLFYSILYSVLCLKIPNYSGFKWFQLGSIVGTKNWPVDFPHCGCSDCSGAPVAHRPSSAQWKECDVKTLRKWKLNRKNRSK